jgi:hypothetical protein
MLLASRQQKMTKKKKDITVTSSLSLSLSLGCWVERKREREREEKGEDFRLSSSWQENVCSGGIFVSKLYPFDWKKKLRWNVEPLQQQPLIPRRSFT